MPSASSASIGVIGCHRAPVRPGARNDVQKSRFSRTLSAGFSASMWSNKHNTHHSVPNVHGDHDGAQNGDPDIDTMPLLAWSRSMLKKATTPMAQWCVKHQAFTYFPLLSVARLSWLQQSIEYAFKPNKHSGRYIAGTDKLKPLPYENVERASLVAHYAWYFAIAFSCPSVFDAVWFVAISNISCGLSLALVFGLGHNGMAVYDAAHRPDYWKLQVTTTRNVKQDRFGFVHWFCGGLDYQVEHHLFPTVPRHHLKKVNELTMAFCAARGVTYHEAGLIAGTVEVLKHLKDIAEEFIEPGNTATDDKRPAFQRMIDAGLTKPPPFHVILVHSFSRFFRDQFLFEFYAYDLKHLQIQFC